MSAKIRVSHVAAVPSVATMDEQNIEWAVEGLIARGAVTLLTGRSGDGKSYCALSMCGAIASGQPFAGLTTTRLPVCYCDRENNLWLVQTRMREMGIIDGDEFEFRYWGGWLKPEPP